MAKAAGDALDGSPGRPPVPVTAAIARTGGLRYKAFGVGIGAWANAATDVDACLVGR